MKFLYEGYTVNRAWLERINENQFSVFVRQMHLMNLRAVILGGSRKSVGLSCCHKG